MELILGIDEAGKGPVIGPMVIAGCLISKNKESRLKKAGVKDSKQLTQKKRESLAELIKQEAETFEIERVFPKEIDFSSKKGINLAALEAIIMAKIINKINKGFKKIKIVIDCPSVSIEKWESFLKTKIKKTSNLEIICKHKADKTSVAVSAASILAKDIREKEMDFLKKKYGKEIGSGYPSDITTKKFLEKNVKNYKSGLFRTSWKTWKDAFNNFGQKKLT